jgi:L-fuconolactonase
MKIDSHQHFWKLARGDYKWLTPNLKSLYKDFLPEDLAPNLLKFGIGGSILIQATPTLSETYFMLDTAEKTYFVKGVIGWIDMASKEDCDKLVELKNNPYFKGIRPMVQDILDVNWMLNPLLKATFQHLVTLDLIFEALVKPIHLENLLRLLRRYPDLRIVIDHGAKPNILQGEFSQWSKNIKKIAQQTQAYCKISGLLTEAAVGSGLKEISPYIDHLLECFGSKRLIWGSDWPVINLMSNYSNWYNLTEEYLEKLSIDERQEILGNNAELVYKV